MTALIISLRQQWEPLGGLSRFGAGMLVLSGMATGLSWLCYYRALQLAPASRVAPIDKLSVALVILLSVLLLGEKLTWKLALGGVMISAGAVLVAL
jgi:transporter family protein